jgi:hypothetical protein
MCTGPANNGIVSFFIFEFMDDDFVYLALVQFRNRAGGFGTARYGVPVGTL